MKINNSFLLLLIVISLASCVNNKDGGAINPNITASLDQSTPIITNMPTFETTQIIDLTKTPTIKPTQVIASPTLSSIPTQIDWPNGGLWVHSPPNNIGLSSNSEYRIFSEGGKLIASVQRMPDCSAEPYLNSSKVICWGTDTNYVYDLETGEKVPIPKSEGDLFLVPSGKYVVYVYCKDIFSSCSLYQFDIETQKKIVYESLINGINEVAMSPDNQHLVVVGFFGNLGRRVAEIYPDGKGPRIIELIDQHTEGDVSWSPESDKLIYGVGEVQGIGTTSIFLVNFNNYQAQLLMKPPEGKKFDTNMGSSSMGHNTAWSPDGKYIAIPMKNELCIFYFSDSNQKCFQLTESGKQIYRYRWSPESDQIAVIIQEDKSPFPNDNFGDTLLIYSLKDAKIEMILQGQTLDAIFWR
jgi:WD40 repeat protein